MGKISDSKLAASCSGCFSWGQLPGRFCRGCYTYGQLHEAGRCVGCRREVPVDGKHGYCRLCRAQATWAIKASGKASVIEPYLRQVTCQQLFFANLQRPKNGGPRVGKAGRRVLKPPPLPEPHRVITTSTQLTLFTVTRDFRRFDRQLHADLTNPWLIRAQQAARALGEARGWSRWITSDVIRALVIVLSGYREGGGLTPPFSVASATPLIGMVAGCPPSDEGRRILFVRTRRSTSFQGSVMTRPRLPCRRIRGAMSGIVLLAVTAGVVTACADEESSAHTSAFPASASATPGTHGTAGVAKLHMIENEGHRLAFHVTGGSGPVIVLDAGGGEDSSYWKDVVPKLHTATGAEIITYDRAGLGQSEAVAGPWQVESAVSDLTTGLRKLGVTRDVILVSHSQAGEIATYLTKQNPGLVSGSVLVDASLPPLYTDEEIARIVAANQPAVDAAKKEPSKPQNKQLISTAESYAPMHKAYHQVSWPDTVPATVIVSEKTPFDGSPEDAQRWRDAAATFARQGPNRALVTATGSSHDVPKDRPALVLKEIEKMATTQG
ncbi:alpha/beta fold hydrolase [Streptomyces hygroscopicus]|uniref:alpha/beta fold hydrolase n=1 Tax=Streptomyces hygroscopicus TaxID=1912 RepID=UPI000A8A4161|nr:alpha/beta hydrolase [Streptomyces hygroscopicus]